MSTQQDIYAAGSETRPPMLNKENYVPWSSCLLRYAKSRPNGKLIYNSIMNVPYVRRMIPEPGDQDREVPVEADDQAIQTILLGLPEEIYATVNSCETAQEIWLRVQQMIKGFDIGIQEKKDKLLNEWERLTSIYEESIESYYHRFFELMNDFKRNKHFPKKIASNLKFLNNLQLEWRQHVTIVHQTKDLHTASYAQLYDFLKYHDPLALMANSNNPFSYLVFHQDQPSPSTFMQQPLPRNNYNPQPSFNQNYMQQPMLNHEDITDPTTAMNMAFVLMAKAFKLSTPTNNNQRTSSNYATGRLHNQVVQNAVQNPDVQSVGNHNGLIVVPGITNQNPNKNGNVIAARAEVRPRRNLQTHLLIAQKEEAGIQLQAKEFVLIAATGDLDEIEEVNANCILMSNLKKASTSGTQTDKAPVYDSDGSAKNDSNVISEVSSVEQGGGTVEQHPATVEETHDYFESLYNNLAIKVEKVNTVNRKLRETNADLTNELARYKNQEKCFEISQEKYDTLERCYQKSVYQEQCLTKNINALHLSFGKQITTLNEKIANLNNQLLKEKSIVSSLQEEKKKLKSDFKIREDELLDKQIQLENKIKELDNLLVKTANESLAKYKALEFEIERLLRAVVSQDIMSIVQNPTVVETFDLQTELECTKEQFENCIIKKENEYAKLWNDWYKKCEECKYNKISYDKAYNDMQQKIERLQARLGDLNGKCKDTPCVSDTLDLLSKKLENENVELEF
ncbi:hypothetical protein Tco_0407186 [Tanacetum coccineum]